MIETQMPLIDDTARIHSSAVIGESVTIGPWVSIGPNVVIGDHTKIESHAVILRDTTLGQHNHIHSHAVVGGDPQDLTYRGEKTVLKIGDHNTVREFVTINRGSVLGGGVTTVGNHNCFLSYSHVAHDAVIGDHVLFVNNASIAGHVTVDDYAIIGAYVAVHQFTRIGAYSFLVHAAQVSHDIPPFMLVKGTPGLPIALNVVGLKRRGFTDEKISGLKKAFRCMYRQNLSSEEMHNTLAALAKETAEVHFIIELLKNSKRGIVRKQSRRI